MAAIVMDVIEQALTDAQQRQAHSELEKDGPLQKGGKKTANVCHKLPIELKTYTHSLEAAVIFILSSVRAEQKTRELRRRRGGAGEVSGL